MLLYYAYTVLCTTGSETGRHASTPTRALSGQPGEGRRLGWFARWGKSLQRVGMVMMRPGASLNAEGGDGAYEVPARAW